MCSLGHILEPSVPPCEQNQYEQPIQLLSFLVIDKIIVEHKRFTRSTSHHYQDFTKSHLLVL